jgi:hypothetical protein
MSFSEGRAAVSVAGGKGDRRMESSGFNGFRNGIRVKCRESGLASRLRNETHARSINGSDLGASNRIRGTRCFLLRAGGGIVRRTRRRKRDKLKVTL